MHRESLSPPCLTACLSPKCHVHTVFASWHSRWQAPCRERERDREGDAWGRGSKEVLHVGGREGDRAPATAPRLPPLLLPPVPRLPCPLLTATMPSLSLPLSLPLPSLFSCPLSLPLSLSPLLLSLSPSHFLSFLLFSSLNQRVRMGWSEKPDGEMG